MTNTLQLPLGIIQEVADLSNTYSGFKKLLEARRDYQRHTRFDEVKEAEIYFKSAIDMRNGFSEVNSLL